MRTTASFTSEEDRAFYLANCLGSGATARATAMAQATAKPVSTPAPQATPAGFPANMALIGAVWAPSSIPVPYCVNPAGIPLGTNSQPILTASQFVTIVQQAFQKWQDIPNSAIAFEYRGTCTNSARISNDGVNTIGWARLLGSTIGVTDPGGNSGRIMRQDSSGLFREVDIAVDIQYARTFATNPTKYVQVDLPYILLHEAGHFLGLGHSTDPCSVMQPEGIHGSLCAIDIAAAASLYPTR